MGASSSAAGKTVANVGLGFLGAGGAQGADGNPVYGTSGVQQQYRTQVPIGGQLKTVSNAPVQPSTQPSVFNQASQGLTAAMAGTAGEMGYRPQNVAATSYNPALMSAGQLAGTDMSAYMNPYEQNVIQGLQKDALEGQQMASNQLGAQATAAKAFGGSRHGVAEGQMASGIQNQLNQQIAGLRQSGYQNAQQMAQQDIANRMQAGAANQAAINAAGQFGAGNMMQAQLANQSAGLAGSQQRLGAASQMGNLSNLGFGMGQQINQQMMQQGAMQQALQQMAMDKAAAQYQGYQNSPYQALSAYTTALGGSPKPSTQTTSQNRGLFDYLGLGASIYPYLP